MSSRSPHKHPNTLSDADFTALVKKHPVLQEHLAKPPRAVARFDVPDTGGYPTSGDYVFIDRHLARARPVITGVPYEQWLPALVAHEWTEKGCIQLLGMPYEEAHRYASVEENRVCRSLGITPRAYNDGLKPFIKRGLLERITVPPKNLDCSPYKQNPDRNDRRVLARFKALGVVDA